jgi:hypothetical protein
MTDLSGDSETVQAEPKPGLTIGDVLRHLVMHIPVYGEENRAGLLEAVNAEYPPPEPVKPELSPEEKAAEDEKDARIADLEAQLRAVQAS